MGTSQVLSDHCIASQRRKMTLMVEKTMPAVMADRIILVKKNARMTAKALLSTVE